MKESTIWLANFVFRRALVPLREIKIARKGAEAQSGEKSFGGKNQISPRKFCIS